MVNKKECPHCKKIIEFEHRNGFASHIGNCKQRPGYIQQVINSKIANKRRRRKKEYKINCKKCNKEYVLNLTLYKYNTGDYKKHCSHTCANSHMQTKEQNQKRSEKLKGRELVEREIRICPICNIKFKVLSTSKQKSCGKKECFILISGSSYLTKIEELWKPKIEKYLNTKDLKKERIGERWFDFTNKKYIIEFTLDSTAGISDAIKRFKSIIDEKRKKLLICPDYMFGNKRKKELTNINVEYINAAVM